jgi:signal transduction histidine kinase
MMLALLNRLSVRNRIWTIVLMLIGSIMIGSVVNILMLREALWHERELKTRQLVETGFGILSELHARQVRGELSEAAAKETAIGAIRAMRYDEKEYFWLNDLGTPFPKMIMHPTVSSLNGQLLDSEEFNHATGERVGSEGAFTPTDGKKNLFLSFAAVLDRGGAGYVTYTWPKPKVGGGVTEQHYPKLSYVKKFEPWGWVIGTGVYVDDVESAVREQAGRNAQMVAGIGILLLLFASLMARSITQPLRRTVTTMHAIGKGDAALATRLPVEGGSEIAELALGFNQMLERLEARDAELARQRESLEEEVARRTTDLRDANVQLAAEQQEIKALLEKMKDAQSQLLQSEKLASIGQLAAGVAHEINNPIGFVHSNLSALGGYVKSLLALLAAYEQLETTREPADEILARLRAMKAGIDLPFIREDLPALIAESNQGIDRVARIVQNLKDFSHVDQDDQWALEDLHKGLDSTISVAWNELKYKCELKREYGELPPVECLMPQLNQVFLNLLMNAAHAIETRGVVTLRSGATGDQVWLEVSDTGKGIAPENIKRIFDPFFTTAPVGKGTGLGLSVSYSIVKKHHGRIEVESRVGAGTTFRIWLPLRQPHADAKLSPASDETATSCH